MDQRAAASDADEGDPKRIIPAIGRASRILDLVARSRAPQTLSQMARELGIAKSTAHTLCRSLVELDLLIRRPDQTYRLGPHLMRWSQAFLRQSDIATEFAAIWDSETEMPGATITLSVRDGAEVVYIAARNSALSHPLVDFRAGMRLPAAFTATGKALLSRSTEAELRRLFDAGLPRPLTPHSVRSLADLRAELSVVRRTGIAIDNQQVAEGMVCFGAPVLDSAHQAIAGVAVSQLVEDMTPDLEPRIVATLKRVASRLSARMGADLGAPVD
ncbi:IclR family transcriptional regulator [Pseudohoeflea coraliihabitans]|uniref:IclR family transcriptional regulator n=1 Tax=Pseudohoeflea coraliihabitans TaxID=2860393 RepID=A0ABS6WJR3_9HYPH|nr:IclR family transcriptional regulator [Pseudohoeflea sp. DP4N28-3]MBW3096186.1 IclR family transcriptional regulator [Pseudohoeflea sp. DP4N28-3]